MTGRLILVKHSQVDVVAERPPRTWELSAEGRRRALVLADRLAGFRAVRVVSSVEPKAIETAEIIGQRLSLATITSPGLHEHERETAPFLGREAFAGAIAWLFDEPHRVVFGEESANTAADRFAAGVDSVTGDGDDIIVTHGTVIALYVSRTAGVEPFPLWRSLGLPSYVVLSERAVEVVTAIV